MPGGLYILSLLLFLPALYGKAREKDSLWKETLMNVMSSELRKAFVGYEGEKPPPGGRRTGPGWAGGQEERTGGPGEGVLIPTPTCWEVRAVGVAGIQVPGASHLFLY